jgi:hypothetical protein
MRVGAEADHQPTLVPLRTKGDEIVETRDL